MFLHVSCVFVLLWWVLFSWPNMIYLKDRNIWSLMCICRWRQAGLENITFIIPNVITIPSVSSWQLWCLFLRFISTHVQEWHFFYDIYNPIGYVRNPIFYGNDWRGNMIENENRHFNGNWIIYVKQIPTQFINIWQLPWYFFPLLFVVIVLLITLPEAEKYIR